MKDRNGNAAIKVVEREIQDCEILPAGEISRERSSESVLLQVEIGEGRESREIRREGAGEVVGSEAQIF